MAGDTLRLQVILDAVDRATGPLRKIMAGSKGMAGAMRQSSKALKELKAQQERLQGFRELKNRVDASGTAFRAAQQRVRLMRTEMAGVAEPTARATAALAKAERGAERLKQTHMQGLRALKESKQALGAAGIGARDFGTAERKLQSDIARTTAAMKVQQRNLAALDAAKRRAASIHRAGMTASAYGAGMMFAGQRGLRASVAPVGAAMTLESAMADVRKVVDFDTPQQFAEMTRDVQSLSLRLPMIPEEIAQIVAAAGQSGIVRKELLRFADDAARMGVAFDTTAQDAGQTMATWRTAFRMNQDQVVTLADKINYLGNTGPASVAKISEVVNRIGALGEVAGLQSGPLAALGATVAGMGIESEVSATGIKNMLLTLSSGHAATKRQRTAMKAIGVDATKMAQHMQRDAGGAIMLVLERLRQLPAASQAATLTQLFGRESVGAIAPLLTNLKLLQTNFKKVTDEQKYGGSMAAEYASRVATSENALQLAKNAALVLAQTVGQTLLPDFKVLAERTGAVVHRMIEWMRANPETVKGLAKVVIIGTALITVLGGLLMGGGVAAMAFSQIYKAVAILSGGSGLGGLVMRFGSLVGQLFPTLFNVGRALLPLLGGVSAPILAIGAAIAIVGVMIWRYWEPIKAFMVGMWRGIVDAMSPVVEEMQAALAPLAPVWDLIAEGLGKVWGWIKQLFTPFDATNEQLQNATGYGRNFGQLLGVFLSGQIRALVHVIGWMVSAFKAVHRAVVPVIVGIWDYVRGAWTMITGIFSGDGDKVRAGLLQMWAGINSILSGWPAKMMQAGVNMVTGLVSGIKSRLGAAAAASAGVGTRLIDKFTGVMDINSPSRVFAKFGDYTMQGLANGLLRSEQRPLQAVLGLGNRMRQAGAGIALASAISPAMAIDSRPPVSPATVGLGIGGGDHVEIHIHAAPGMDLHAIAAEVRRALDQRDRDREARSRSRLRD